MDAFGQALLLTAVAELGDKSQLIALAYGVRFSWRVALLGVSLAALLVQLLSVTVGSLVGAVLPDFWLRLAAGLAFIGFGLWTLRGGEEEDDEVRETKLARFGPLLTVVSTFFLAEFGDKTMFVSITLASQYASFVGVWLGATAGMMLVNAGAVAAGRAVGDQLPERVIRVGAAVIFILFGLFFLAEALGVFA